MTHSIILTGPVGTGKTTTLQQLIRLHPDRFAGILAPVIHQQRHLQDISTGELRLLETPPAASDALPVGKYVFSAAVFAWARERLVEQAASFPQRWFILDEVGKLEVQGKGLAPVAMEMLRGDRVNNLIVVIRDSLLNQVTENLPRQYTVTHKEKLSSFLTSCMAS